MHLCKLVAHESQKVQIGKTQSLNYKLVYCVIRCIYLSDFYHVCVQALCYYSILSLLLSHSYLFHSILSRIVDGHESVVGRTMACNEVDVLYGLRYAVNRTNLLLYVYVHLCTTPHAWYVK